MNNELIIKGEDYENLREYLRKAEEAQLAYMEATVTQINFNELEQARNQRRAVVFHQIKMLMRNEE